MAVLRRGGADRLRIAAVIALLAATVAGPRAARGAQAPAPEIDRIEIEGVVALQAETVRAAIELSPGETVDPERIERARRNLREIYHNHGYEEAEVRAVAQRQRNPDNKTETVLTLRVTEGRPTRIGAFTAEAQGGTSREASRHFARIIESVMARGNIQIGELLDTEKIANVRRALVEAFAAQNHLNVRVGDPLVRGTLPPAGQENVKGIRWVTVTLPVWPGDQIDFGFRDNTVLTLSRLDQLVEEQRTLGFGKDPVAAVRGRIEDEYRALGFANVSTVAVTTENARTGSRHVSIRINEGVRVRIDRVDFDGNIHFKDDELREQFFARASASVQQGYYVEKDAQKAAELMIEWMKSKGYLSAKLLTVNAVAVQQRRAGDSSRSVRLVIYLYEWDQTVVRSIHITGAAAIPPAEIERILGISEGQPLNLFHFSEGIEEVKARYRALGYLNARLLNENTEKVVVYTAQNRNADITLEISEGPQFRCGKITIDGLTFTKDYVVRRELNFGTGDVLEETRITGSQAALRRLGIFSSAQIRLVDDPERPGIKDVNVLIQEGTPGLMAGGIGYRNDLGARAFGGIGYTNLFGQAHTLALDANINRRLDESFCVKQNVKDSGCFVEYQAQVSYVWPWFLPGDTTLRPAITSSTRIYKLFDAQALSVAMSLEKKLVPNLVGVFTASFERVRQFNALEDSDNRILNIGSVTPSLRLDLRDNPLAPTSGFFASGSFEVATPWLGSSGDGFPLGYTRFQMRTDQFIPLGRGITWYLSFRTGIARSTEPYVINSATGKPDPKSGSIPLIKQFTLGGAGSLRGFKDQDLNDQAIAIFGTQTFVNYRTQLDLPFVGSLRFGPFIDVANLLLDNYSFTQGLRAGAGFGFHYQTPVGPVNFDYGFKLDPRPGESASELYFSIGVL